MESETIRKFTATAVKSVGDREVCSSCHWKATVKSRELLNKRETINSYFSVSNIEINCASGPDFLREKEDSG